MEEGEEEPNHLRALEAESVRYCPPAKEEGVAVAARLNFLEASQRVLLLLAAVPSRLAALRNLDQMAVLEVVRVGVHRLQLH